MGSVRRPSYVYTDPKTGKKERRQSKVWQLRYTDSTGRRVEESSGKTRKGEALAMLKAAEGRVAEGRPLPNRKLSFEDAVALVVTDYEVNGKKTLRDVKGRISNHLQPHFAGWPLESIRRQDVVEYTLQRQQEGAANASIARELAILKRAFSLAMGDGLIHYRPAIPMPEERNTRTGFFEAEEFEDVCAALPSELRGLVRFLYLTGWRVGEARPLQWKQVDRKAGVIRLEPETTKNRRGRTLPYAALPELAAVIEEQWQEHQRLAKAGTISPWVFVRRNGDRIKDFRGAWQSACQTAGVPGRLVHDLRRTAIRNLVRAGVSEQVAMKLSGHKTRSVFARYDVTSEADLTDAMQKLGAASGKVLGKSAESGRVRTLRESS